MIVSHKHRFIFLKTYKTASTSMETALTSLCGEDDIVTPTRDDLSGARAVAGQNCRIDHPLKPKIKLWRRLLMRPERYYHPTIGYYEHIPAWRVKAYLGDARWNSYYKFCFERNPWDRQVSWYYYKTRNLRKRPGFDKFMRVRKRAYVPNFEVYSIDGKIAVDRVGRYERATEDFESILSDLGLSGQLGLSRENVSTNKSFSSYREPYRPELSALVGDWYAREIAHFNYTF